MRATKRDVLLETAERLFHEEGFHATGIDRVVAEAGVARMTLYNHFASKEALVEAVLARRYRRYLDDLRAAIAAPDADGATITLARRHGDWLVGESRHGCIVIKAIGEFELHHTGIADLGRSLKQDLLEVLREALAIDGKDDEPELAERLLLLLEGSNALTLVLDAAQVRSHLETMFATATVMHAGDTE